MKRWLKRIRGALGIGLTWAAAWVGFGSIVALVGGSGLSELLLRSALLGGAGFIGGSIFSVVLGIAEGRRRFDEMSLPRFAGLGAVGGFLIAAPLVALSVVAGGTPNAFLSLAVISLMGAGSAAGSLALARRADDRELLDAGEGIAEIGMTDEEKHQLLGK